jgi:hypothetical protein
MSAMARTKDQTQLSLTPVLASCRSMAILIVAAYVLINIILVALGPLTIGWPTWAVTALAVPPMVLAMVYVVIPIARRGGQM